MVLNQIISNILEMYLGQYIENIDTNKLRFSAWQGKVTLQNLRFKSTAFSYFSTSMESTSSTTTTTTTEGTTTSTSLPSSPIYSSTDISASSDDFLQFLKPLVIQQGVIGNLNILIPWNKLSSSPTVLELEDLYLVIRPRRENEVHPEDEKIRQLERKKRKLETYSLIEQQQSNLKQQQDQQQQQSQSYYSSYVSRLTQLIINNLQLRVHNVHIRYEDTFTDQKVCFVQ